MVWTWLEPAFTKPNTDQLHCLRPMHYRHAKPQPNSQIGCSNTKAIRLLTRSICPRESVSSCRRTSRMYSLNKDSLSRIFSMARNRGSRLHFDANSLNVDLTKTLNETAIGCHTYKLADASNSLNVDLTKTVNETAIGCHTYKLADASSP